MDTIALWEDEIYEANRSHFFEETTNAINFLYESISLDMKLIDEGILLEENEEDGESDKLSPMKEKIALFFAKIIAMLSKMIAKIGQFIKNIVNNTRYKMLEKKIKDADIDPKKAAKYLTKAKFFDANKVYKQYKTLIDNMSIDFDNLSELSEKAAEKLEVIGSQMAEFIAMISSTKYSNKDLESSAITFDDDMNMEMITYKLHNILDDTNNCIGELRSGISFYKTVMEDCKKSIKNGENKDVVHFNKGMIKCCKNMSKATQLILKEFIGQSMAIYKIYIKLLKEVDYDDDFDDLFDEDFDDNFDDASDED